MEGFWGGNMELGIIKKYRTLCWTRKRGREIED